MGHIPDSPVTMNLKQRSSILSVANFPGGCAREGFRSYVMNPTDTTTLRDATKSHTTAYDNLQDNRSRTYIVPMAAPPPKNMVADTPTGYIGW